MSKKITALMLIFVVAIFILTSFKLLNRQIVENDEGIYWTTFLLLDKGFTLYREITFSQLPGFFISSYAIFNLLGSSIAAARFSILYWTLIGLAAVIRLGYLKKNLLLSLLSISLVLGIPVFINQSITLQSDIVAASFSVISFVMMTEFIAMKNQNKIPLILSALCFSLAVLTKFDFSLAMPFAYLLLTEKKNKFAKAILFSLITAVSLVLITVFFDFNSVINNVYVLRQKASALYSFEPIQLFRLLKDEFILSLIAIINLLFIFIKRKRDRFSVSLMLWFTGSLILVILFRPVFRHHLVFLTFPAVLLFVNNLNLEIKPIKNLIIFALITISLFSFFQTCVKIQMRQYSAVIKDRAAAEKFIQDYTGRNDLIITDEASLYGITGRLPPPELADLSQVQINSKNISAEKIIKAVNLYKPKIILIWNGRLNRLKSFFASLNGYRIAEIGNGKTALIRE